MAKTGYIINPVEKKVTNDSNEFPLDVNGNLCSLSGLPQDTRSNVNTNPTYRIYNPTLCPPNPDLYYNITASATATKNNCPVGQLGSNETYTVASGTYSSTISQSDADAQAQADLNANKQNYANTNGTCTTPDITPNPFAFTTINNAELTTPYTSNIITISGLGTGVAAELQLTNNGQYSKNSAAFTTVQGVISNGDTLQMRGTSSASYDTVVVNTIRVGNFASSFSIRTKLAPVATNYLLTIGSYGPGDTQELRAVLVDPSSQPVTVSQDVSFDWGAVSTPVGGGSSESIGGTSVLLAGTSSTVLTVYDSSNESLSSLIIQNPNPTTVDGHPITV